MVTGRGETSAGLWITVGVHASLLAYPAHVHGLPVLAGWLTTAGRVAVLVPALMTAANRVPGRRPVGGSARPEFSPLRSEEVLP
jgi:hypothetical protein